ncbi:hypothetical protein GGR95_002943 [Sulfitobacter undariae]|uniref:Uncharacterized protein n=1 Tax=Sulfitobacter undariae TaxID=1563671 RepID=A0A7W6E5S4_9RHOB|nr:hypothetical protein [Sulfitobacter undariae]
MLELLCLSGTSSKLMAQIEGTHSANALMPESPLTILEPEGPIGLPP